MGEHGADARVLVVDDQPDVADAFATQLARKYETNVAYTGEEALEKVDDSIDVILLDRRMPKLSGDDVLAEIQEWGLECRIIVVSAVDPDFDIVDMPFDEYLCKPVTADELLDGVERQLRATEYGDRVPEFIELTSKLDALETQKTDVELDETAEVEAMRERATEIGAQIQDVIENFDSLAVDLAEYN
jgi:DNA-binding response OmpR family regulator